LKCIQDTYRSVSVDRLQGAFKENPVNLVMKKEYLWKILGFGLKNPTNFDPNRQFKLKKIILPQKILIFLFLKDSPSNYPQLTYFHRCS
jgi:hypothetical protein